MTKFALQIFNSITSNPEYPYYEIKINGHSNNVILILRNKDKTNGTEFSRNSIDIEQLLNGSLPDKLEKNLLLRDKDLVMKKLLRFRIYLQN